MIKFFLILSKESLYFVNRNHIDFNLLLSIHIMRTMVYLEMNQKQTTKKSEIKNIEDDQITSNLLIILSLKTKKLNNRVDLIEIIITSLFNYRIFFSKYLF